MKRTLFLCFALCSFMACKPVARFTTVGAAPVKAPPDSTKIAVFVYSEKGVQNQPDELQAYLTTALLARGYKARAIDVELGFAKTQLSGLENGKYAGGEGLINALSNGGKLEGELKTFEGLLNRTEKNDEISRYQALEFFLKQLPTSWDYTHLLVVHQMSDFNYASYLINIATHDVINSFVISGNARGFRTFLPKPPVGTIQSLELADAEKKSSIRDVNVFKGADLFRVSFYIVGLL
jgi:hypothetical protein